MEYTNKTKKEENDERYTLGQWRLIESMERGNPIEIPSLNLRLNPNGSATSFDKKAL
jgi:hypothetical protein